MKSLKAMGTDEEHMAMLAKVAVDNGDILRLDLAVPNKGINGGTNKDGGFGKMGGRRLGDDVVDATFTIINNGKPLGDKVDKNDVDIHNTFPFVPKPHQPAAPDEKLDDGTRQ